MNTCLTKLIIADIAPRAYPPHHQTILAGLEVTEPQTAKSRREAEERMATMIAHRGVRQFLLKNLYRTENGLDWRMNLTVISEQIENVGEPQTFKRTINTPTLFIRGAKSGYISDQDQQDIKQHFSECAV